jgi:hypothetical protein
MARRLQFRLITLFLATAFDASMIALFDGASHLDQSDLPHFPMAGQPIREGTTRTVKQETVVFFGALATASAIAFVLSLVRSTPNRTHPTTVECLEPRSESD